MTAIQPWNVQRADSKEGNVWKYVFTKNNAVAEAVLYRYPTFEERTVICISTQSGCPVGCRFCGAGDKFIRSLKADEIVSQVVHLLADQNIDATKVKKMQIMFMSMGEPLLNQRPLMEAIKELNKLYPQARLLISTSGPATYYGKIRELSVQIPEIGLQFSVHESTDEKRNALIPFSAKLKLEEIAGEGVRWYHATKRRPFFNYCAHEGNVSDQDVANLYDLFDPNVWECTVSVVCEREENVAAANARQRELAAGFMQKMIEKGYSTRMFDPAGQDDIGGGCGQLWYVQDWMAKNSHLGRNTFGHLDVVHAPRACE